MHQLSIDHNAKSVSISEHSDFNDAHRALMTYVVGADYYLRQLGSTDPQISYELVQLAGDDDPAHLRRPRITGRATIEEITRTALPVASPYYTACDAQRWISEHDCTWRHGSEGDPGHRYPMTLLTMAHAEAHYTLRAGAVLPEAARLAGVEDSPAAEQPTVEALRHSAVGNAGRHRTPAELAVAVQQLLPAGTDDHQTAALVWYYALILWGASAT
jgi:hypothetical protein